MINLILASELTGADILVGIILFITIGSIVLGLLCGIYELVSNEVSLRKARESQRLLFNQLKKGSYVWEVVGEELITYVVTQSVYHFDRNNICKEITLRMQSVSESWNTRNIDIPVEESKTFKRNDYYTIYNEADIVRSAIKKKRDEQRNAVSKVSNEELANEVNNVIKRLETIKKEYK